MKSVSDIVMWLILAAVGVLVIMNAQNVATVISSGAGGTRDILSILTGSGYQKPR